MLGYQEIKKDIETETELLSLPAKGERFLCKIGSVSSIVLASLFGATPIKELFFPPYSYSINIIHIN